MTQPMFRRAFVFVSILSTALLAGWASVSGQDQAFTRDIQAQARIFPEIGPGVSALKRDAAGRYYVLAAPATSVVIYGPDGNRVGQIPNANSGGAKITYASDIDIDSEGRLFVADRGSNSVKIFSTDGALVGSQHVAAPMSIAALSDFAFAATLFHSGQLVNVFDARGAAATGFGEAPGSQGAYGAALNPGRLYGDGKEQIYFVFTDLPDPTIRRYDRFGYVSYEISLPASEFRPAREARQWTTVTIGKDAPATKPVISALAIDPETQEVWAAIGNELVHFDKEGNRRAAYLLYTKQHARIDAAAMLVEHNRILIADDPNGIFDFAMPELRQASSPAH